MLTPPRTRAPVVARASLYRCRRLWSGVMWVKGKAWESRSWVDSAVLPEFSRLFSDSCLFSGASVPHQQIWWPCDSSRLSAQVLTCCGALACMNTFYNYRILIFPTSNSPFRTLECLFNPMNLLKIHDHSQPFVQSQWGDPVLLWVTVLGCLRTNHYFTEGKKESILAWLPTLF